MRRQRSNSEISQTIEKVNLPNWKIYLISKLHEILCKIFAIEARNRKNKDEEVETENPICPHISKSVFPWSAVHRGILFRLITCTWAEGDWNLAFTPN